MAAAAGKAPRDVVVVALVTALCLTGDSMLYIALPIYWREAGLDALWQVGVLLAVNRFIRLPFNPLIGALYARISLKTGLLLAVVLGIVTITGYALASGFLAWLALRALWGVAWSFFRIGGLSAVVYCAADDQRGRAMGLYNGLYRLGSLAGMLIGGLLVPVFGLPALALAFGAAAVLGIPLLLFGFHPPAGHESAPKAPASRPTSTIAVPSHWRRIVFNGFSIALLVQGVLAATLSALIAHLYGTEVELLGVLLGVTALSGLLQAARWSWETWLGGRIGELSDGPRGRLPLLVAAQAAMALGFGSLALSLPLGLWLLLCLLVMVLCTALTTLGDALAADAARQGDVVRSMTRYSIAQDLGAALGPPLAFLLLTAPGGFAWLYGGGALLLAGLAALWGTTLRDQRRSA
ncbi:MFS transporter [Stutzerimonas azotifigens]|uniref:MFS transporter n=1 Tax=Stutzerimonas azotifigens TaxID=291995 RepID=UPI00048366C1|nr:MFS transporter [Stutzerimonas azotifigens]